ncbi:hypothetical protein ABPG75_010748 [Micractinium tetrahymenae]
MADLHQAQLLLQAAQQAVEDFQAGHAAPSVADILHLEKRWDKLPGASAGAVALDAAKSLLGSEVLAGDPLEFVVQQVLAAQGLPSAPQLLTKRQFVSLAHVAEVAQSKAFNLLTAEEAAAPRAEPQGASHKKRPPPIRDAHIDTWRIAAAPAGGATDALDSGADGAPRDDAAGQLQAAGTGGLSRATSLVPGAGPLAAGDNSAEGLEAAAAEAAAHQQHQQLLPSGGTSYVSALEAQEQEVEGYGDGQAAGPEEGAVAALPLDAEVEAFTTKLNGLMERVSTDVARHTAVEAAPQHSKGAAPAGEQGEAAARGSWESFGSGGSKGSAGKQEQQQQAGSAVQTPPAAPQPQLNEAVISAAMAAGMTFMQHLQAATGGAAAAMPDVNPLRHAAAVAAAAVAASPSLSMGAGSPEVAPAQGRVGAPQQLIAEMMANLNLGGATPEQLQAAAASLQQQALAMQQRPAASQAGSAGSVASGERSAASHQRSWRAGLEAENQAPQQFSSGPHQQQHQQQRRDLSVSPQKPSRLGPGGTAAAAHDAAAMPPPAPRLRPPAMEGLCAGWTAMSKDDVKRCQAIFNKKGYTEVGGMERHYAMEYFSKLHMEGAIFHTAWTAADLGADGRLDCGEFCLFVQLLRGAQKGLPLPSRLTPEEVAGLLGEAAMPPPPAAPAQVHIDAAHMRAVLSGHSRQGSMAEQAESVIQGFDPDDDDGASSVDSGIAESVISTASRRGPAAHSYALGARPAPAPARSRLGAVLGGGPGGPGAYNPTYARSGVGYPAGPGAEALGQVAHKLLEVAVRSAEIRYRKPLDHPIFTLSVRDSLGRLVELPQDTHPGHYRRETSTIHSSAIVRLTTPLRSMPPGAILFLEIKHWKADKRRFSTLAWAYAPLDKVVDFGPSAARVRGGPVDLPLFKKPVDLTLKRMRRLTSRAYDLHLTLRGIESSSEP